MTKQDSVNVVCRQLWQMIYATNNIVISFDHILKSTDSISLLRLMRINLQEKYDKNPNVQTRMFLDKVNQKLKKLTE